MQAAGESTILNRVVDGLIAQAHNLAVEEGHLEPADGLGSQEQMSRLVKESQHLIKVVLVTTRRFEYWRQKSAVTQLRYGEILDSSLARFSNLRPYEEAPNEWLSQFNRRGKALYLSSPAITSIKGGHVTLEAHALTEKQLFDEFYKNSWNLTAAPLHREYLARIATAGAHKAKQKFISDGFHSATMTHMLYGLFEDARKHVQTLRRGWGLQTLEDGDSTRPVLTLAQADAEVRAIEVANLLMHKRKEYLAAHQVDAFRSASDFVSLTPMCVIGSEDSAVGHVQTFMPSRTVCCFKFQGGSCCSNCGPKLDNSRWKPSVNETHRKTGLRICDH